MCISLLFLILFLTLMLIQLLYAYTLFKSSDFWIDVDLYLFLFMVMTFYDALLDILCLSRTEFCCIKMLSSISDAIKERI